MSIALTHWRFGVDTGTESTHTWYAAEDIVPDAGAIPRDTTFLLRLCLQATGTGQNNIAAQLQYSINAGLSFFNVNTTSDYVRSVTTTVFANGANTTKRLSGTGTFETTSAGCSADGSAGGNSLDIVADGNAEVLYSLQLRSADIDSTTITNGQILFRLNDGAAVPTTGSVPGVWAVRVVTPAASSLTCAGTIASLALSMGLGLGSPAFAGQAPEIAVVGNTDLAVPAGSLVFKGPQRPAGPGQDEIVIPVDTGALLFGGPAITNLDRIPARAELVLSGHAPRSAATLVLDPGVGSLTFTGQTTGNAFGGPDTGGLTLTGFVPEGPEEGGLIEIIPAGALDIAGIAPLVSLGTVPVPDAAVLALTGLAPDAVQVHLSVPDAGTLVLTGLVPPLDETYTTTAGALVLTGEAPDIQRTYLSEPPAADLALIGQTPFAPQTGGDVTDIGVEAGTLILAGQAPGVGVDQSIAPAALVLTGYAPVLDLSVYPAAGILTLTGLAPNAPPGTDAFPDAGALTLTGLAPSLDLAFIVDPGVLTLTGHAPSLPFRAVPTDQVLQARGPKRDLKAGTPTRRLHAGQRRN